MNHAVESLVYCSVDNRAAPGAIMASTTVRVSEETHELLRKLAAATGEPLQRVLERAVENYRREQFFAEL